MSAELELEEEESGGGGAPAWMATFGDLMSLLLTFFVLLLSFANMDVVKFREMLGSVQNALGTPVPVVGQFEVRSTTAVELSESTSSPIPDILEMPTQSLPTIRPVPVAAADRQMLQDIERVIEGQSLENIVEAEIGERGVTLRVKGQLLFDAGSGQLRPESFVFLDEIAKLTRESDYRVSIEGHTDDRPISTQRFPSNWHLSAWRAIAALRYFVDVAGVDPSKVSCAGYADMRPLAPNDSDENRGVNRRVEFVYYRGDSPFGAASQGDGSLDSLRAFGSPGS